MIEPAIKLSIRQKMHIVMSVPKSFILHNKSGIRRNLRIMRLMDEHYLKTPVYDQPRLLELTQGKGI